MRFPASLFALPFLVFPVAGCVDRGSTEAVAALEVENLVAYWGVLGEDSEGFSYIRPAVRFRIRNAGEEPVRYIQAHGTFRRTSAPEEAWGTGYLHSVSEEELLPGEATEEVTIYSDSNYLSKATPERMFDNPLWEDVEVEVFLRVGSSNYTPQGRIVALRRLGPPGIEKYLEQDEEEPLYEINPRQRAIPVPEPAR